MKIEVDDLTRPEIQQLVREHLEDMRRNSPISSCHALGVEELRKSDITFWSVWDNDKLLGCGALKELDLDHGEIKSMRTVIGKRREGVATKLVTFILEEAKKRNYKRVSLETGSTDAYEPAKNLYIKFGFKKCGPFASYLQDPNSLFMTKVLSD